MKDQNVKNRGENGKKRGVKIRQMLWEQLSTLVRTLQAIDEEDEIDLLEYLPRGKVENYPYSWYVFLIYWILVNHIRGQISLNEEKEEEEKHDTAQYNNHQVALSARDGGCKLAELKNRDSQR